MTEKSMQDGIKKTIYNEMSYKKCLTKWLRILLTELLTKWQKESHRLASVALYRMILRLFIATKWSDMMFFAP